MSDKYKCFKCNSENTEEINSTDYYCCSCNNIYKKQDYKLFKKQNRKYLLTKNEKVNMPELVNSSVNYLYSLGFNIFPGIYQDLKNHSRGSENPKAILYKLSILELCAEEELKKIKFFIK